MHGLLRDAHEHVLMCLLYANCVSILTYACAVKNYSNLITSVCILPMNNDSRENFGFAKWQSIRHLRDILGFIRDSKIGRFKD